jgi:hypothetical protein
MSPDSERARHLRRSVVTVESTIPPDMTIAEWRKLLASRRPAKRRRRRRPLGLGRAGKVLELRADPAKRADRCDHLHEITTHYNHERKLLTFLAVCRPCGTERVVETQHYEPRYEPTHPIRRAA